MQADVQRGQGPVGAGGALLVAELQRGRVAADLLGGALKQVTEAIALKESTLKSIAGRMQLISALTGSADILMISSFHSTFTVNWFFFASASSISQPPSPSEISMTASSSEISMTASTSEITMAACASASARIFCFFCPRRVRGVGVGGGLAAASAAAALALAEVLVILLPGTGGGGAPLITTLMSALPPFLAIPILARSRFGFGVGVLGGGVMKTLRGNLELNSKTCQACPVRTRITTTTPFGFHGLFRFDVCV